MHKPIPLSDNIYYVGVNDRRTALFENMWPLHRGVSYNSYLIVDEKITLIDTVEVGHTDKWLARVRALIGTRPIDYLVVNHMEPDHSGAIHLLREIYPNLVIVGNKKTLPMIDGFYGISDKLQEVNEGESLSTGQHRLTFYTVPMVHWPESMVCYEETTGTLFSSDAFGSFGSLDGGIFDDEIDFDHFRDEMRRYYSNIVGKYGNPVQKALSKLGSLNLQTIAPSHGPIYRERIAEMLAMYDQWSRYDGEKGVVIAYASMYGNTEEMAEAIARELAVCGIRHVRMFDVSKTHPSYIISDIFKYKGLILGSPTYSNELHPNMEALVMKLQHMGVTSHVYGAFGSFTWSGAAAKKLAEAGESLKWELVAPQVEEKQGLKAEKYEACLALGRAMANRLNEIFG
ncbi:flavorubredoxin [Breznakibacter xylanolyticus]|uniref:Flavorubredoxin n=1 Tax=Breznakibacter xylanolyticus TaxID=990 RepID=A0A2W7NI00_9BACT|nr:FprA family A-type flavoprotein [Breznakibacter xylanolyticus]PZX12766.1 flavorubredoxin [Breznakibacter xylanolyticus]